MAPSIELVVTQFFRIRPI